MFVSGRTLSLLVGAVLVTACADATAPATQPTQPRPEPTPVQATSSAAPSVIATSSPTAAAPLRIVVDVDAPVVVPANLGDYSWALAASYFLDADTHHAYVIAFGDERGDQRAFHVTSAEGTDWSVDEADPFERLGVEMSDPGPVPGTVIPLDDGGWAMYLGGIPRPYSNGALIWRATAETPGGPWIAHETPVLELGERGAWDDLTLDFPSVVATDNGYAMLYSAVSTTSRDSSSIGLATSADGVTWTRDADPVIEPGACGDESARYAAMPRLMRWSERYVVIYDTQRETAGAWSDDLRTWTCLTDEPLLRAGDLPGGQGIHSFAIAGDGRDVSVLIESLSDGSSALWSGELVLP